jgi:hypothetical protein
MNADHFDRLFLSAAAGLGLLLAGGLNLVLGRDGRLAWFRLPATLALCAAAVGGIAAFTRAEIAGRAAAIISAVLLAAFLLGSDWFARRAAGAFGAARRPGLRWGLVALAGLGTVVGAGVAFDLDDNAELEQAMKDLDMMGRVPSRPSEGARAATDRGAPIVLKEPVEARHPGALGQSEEKVLRTGVHAGQVIRRGEATDVSNCHGWVFTGGKFILAPEDVEQILKDNAYQEVHEPHPGDLVVYRQGGAVSHTAVVRYVAEGQPVLVEGKWGAMGVFMHPADKSCYGTDYTFHRSPRQGHLLVGLGGSPAPADAQPVLATE